MIMTFLFTDNLAWIHVYMNTARLHSRNTITSKLLYFQCGLYGQLSGCHMELKALYYSIVFANTGNWSDMTISSAIS